MSYWSAGELLYTICPDCRRFLTWKVHPRLKWLGASCCERIYNAQPEGDDIFVVSVRNVDSTNLILFPYKLEHTPDGR